MTNYNIFYWNRISPSLSQEQVEDLKSYYKVYHRLIKFIGNSLSMITASGGRASAIAIGGISLIAISTIALLIKAYMEYQSLDIKIQNCHYAFQSYNHLLIMIKDAM